MSRTKRKWLVFYDGYYPGIRAQQNTLTGAAAAMMKVYGRSTGGAAEAAAILLSPEYSDEDVRQVWTANAFSEDKLLAGVLGTISAP